MTTTEEATTTTTAQGPTKVIVAVGTYDGVLAGWEYNANTRKLDILFATAVHDGSVRSLSIAARPDNQQQQPGTVVSTGYDEVLKTHDFGKRLTSSGEIRTPSDLGTPVCAAFCPPLVPPTSVTTAHPSTTTPHTTHCLVGFAAGQLVIYKKRDWSVQHMLKGHEGGVSCMAVHPTGSMALTAGLSDGKLKLWDLTKGRLAYNYKIQPKKTDTAGRTAYDAVNAIVWTEQAYAFCYGSHLTVKDIATGSDWLDVELPSKINQICFLQGPEGLFVAAANNDGSLAVLHVDTTAKGGERRAIMAIEPVEGPVAGEERFKCLQQVADYHVVTANSAGVVSLMDLSGAIRMIMADDDDDENDDDGDKARNADENDAESDSSRQDNDNAEEEELAVDIIDSVQLGSGNRVTCLAAWATMEPQDDDDDEVVSDVDEEENEEKAISSDTKKQNKDVEKKRKQDHVQELDSEALERARSLVDTAKKMRDKRQKKSKKKQKSNA